MPSANNPGKGDAPRPRSVTSEEYARRWARAFRSRARINCSVCGREYRTVDAAAPPGFRLCNSCWRRQLRREETMCESDLPERRTGRCANCYWIADLNDEGFCSKCEAEGV
jgi:hypothetical protein